MFLLPLIISASKKGKGKGKYSTSTLTSSSTSSTDTSTNTLTSSSITDTITNSPNTTLVPRTINTTRNYSSSTEYDSEEEVLANVDFSNQTTTKSSQIFNKNSKSSLDWLWVILGLLFGIILFIGFYAKNKQHINMRELERNLFIHNNDNNNDNDSELSNPPNLYEEPRVGDLILENPAYDPEYNNFVPEYNNSNHNQNIDIGHYSVIEEV
jgi:hypothetical protein